MKLRNKWQQNVSPSSSASSTSYVTSPSSQTSEGNDDDKYNEAWNEVDKEIGNLQKLFSENDNIGYENSYLNNDEFQYQPQRLQNYAPISKTLTTEEKYYDDFDKEEESEMQFIQASEPSEFEKNVQFRYNFVIDDDTIVAEDEEKALQILETCESILKQLEIVTAVPTKKHQKHGLQRNLPTFNEFEIKCESHQQRHRYRYRYHVKNNNTIEEEKNETDVTRVEKEKNDETVVAEDEEKALQIFETCESVLKQLEIITAVPTKKHQKHEKHGLQRNLASNEYEIDCESTSLRAASI
uniref:Uncharacterized protein n=1 Tax=Panagrolaimus davidi TaxID=227884 RepID=A0A914PE52_9BILA